MLTTLQVKLNERVVLFKNSLPIAALEPGRHRFWGRRYTEQRFNTDELVFKAMPGVRAMLPKHWFSTVEIGADQRAVIYRDGVPKVFLRPGTHRYWTLDESVELKRFSTSEAMSAFTSELEALIPKSEYLDAKVEAYQQGLLYVQGQFVRELASGRYRFWQTPERKHEVLLVDLRRRNVAITGQELITKDKVTLRLSLTVDYAIVQSRIACERVTDVQSAVYLAAQLAARDYVAGVTLDGLLEGRDEFSKFLKNEVAPKLVELGVRLESIGVKDVVLPGEMKTILNRVIEAEKEAAANVISRREETAATRSLANTARVMAEQPVLLRLRELETLKEIAESIGEVHLVVGAEGVSGLLPKLLENK